MSPLPLQTGKLTVYMLARVGVEDGGASVVVDLERWIRCSGRQVLLDQIWGLGLGGPSLRVGRSDRGERTASADGGERKTSDMALVPLLWGRAERSASPATRH